MTARLSDRKPPYGRKDIERIVPHRPPFLFVDEILEVAPERLLALSRIHRAEPSSAGPGVVPGVFLIEAMAQAGLVLYSYSFFVDELFFLAKTASRFHHPVLAGEEIRLVLERVKFLPTMGLGRGEAFAGGRKVFECELGFARRNAANPLL